MTETKLGRPPFYSNVEDLQSAIDSYFEKHTGIEYDDNGDLIAVNPPTVSGLALFLGFSDRQSIYDYKGKEAFSCTIKKAITKIEEFAESQLFNAKTPTGAIFWLKNHGWSDKHEVEHSGEINNIAREEREQRIKELLNKAE